MGFNLSKPAGDKQFNQRDDVLMVQALLRLIVEAFHGGRMTGMKSAGEVPDFNGRMDAVTLAAIRTFQRRWAHNLIRSDGVIHPARYRFRNITANPRDPLIPGAKHVGIIQSLIVTCRLHGIDPYTYLVDVLQRVAEHLANRVAELTPRVWKQHFADKVMHSDLHGLPA
jgi:hypothetical protein